MENSRALSTPADQDLDQLEAGTGFMPSPLSVMQHLEELGYKENLVPCYDHFEVENSLHRAYPRDFRVDQIFRFENASDPDDQSVLYAISAIDQGWKGLFLESYGLYHEEMSQALINQLRDHPSLV